MRDPHRRVIAATCRRHGGGVGYTNLLVTREPGTVVLDPHLDDSCVLTLADGDAAGLYEALGAWLAEGRER
ncbi:MAG: hypothetical protein ACRDTE_13520 [Pseudonocardiaceae bacterium]